MTSQTSRDVLSSATLAIPSSSRNRNSHVVNASVATTGGKSFNPTAFSSFDERYRLALAAGIWLTAKVTESAFLPQGTLFSIGALKKSRASPAENAQQSPMARLALEEIVEQPDKKVAESNNSMTVTAL